MGSIEEFEKNENLQQEFFRVNNNKIYVQDKIKNIDKELEQFKMYEDGIAFLSKKFFR